MLLDHQLHSTTNFLFELGRSRMNNRAHVSTHVPTHHGQERKGRGGSVYCLSRVAWRYFVSSYNGYRMHDNGLRLNLAQSKRWQYINVTD